jgi:hypothetical protein
MKKGLIITISVIATAGLGYFVYRKISDMNKEIIKDGTFTIKVDEVASTGLPTEEDFAQNVTTTNFDDSYGYGDVVPNWGSYDSAYDSYAGY